LTSCFIGGWDLSTWDAGAVWEGESTGGRCIIPVWTRLTLHAAGDGIVAREAVYALLEDRIVVLSRKAGVGRSFRGAGR
jgi:hypothetical protein